MTGVYALKPWKDRELRGLTQWLANHGVNAGQITCLGLFLGIVAAGLIWNHQRLAGLLLLGLSVLADLLDGSMARFTKTDSFQGKIFDAVSDRIVETAWIITLIVKGLLPWWGILLALGSITLLFCRYWAYRQGQDTSYVLVARFERMLVLVCVLVFPRRALTHFLAAAVIVGTWISVFKVVSNLRLPINRNRFTMKIE